MSTEVLNLEDIIVDTDLYPRQKPDDAAIARYVESIDRLPAIQVARFDEHYVLVDGYHRLLTHKRENRATIPVIIRHDLMTREAILIEAIVLNSDHGDQLSLKDKQRNARRLFSTKTTSALANILKVSDNSIRRWTKDLEEFESFKQRLIVCASYLRGLTEEDIGDVVGMTKQNVNNWINSWKEDSTKKLHLAEFCRILSQPEPDDLTERKQQLIEEYLGPYLLDPAAPPPSLKLYDVWNFNNCDPHYGAEYPGRIPGQIIENLLWYYANEPFAKVYDPFAGSGTTIDVCRAMFRRYWASDLNPFDATKGIRQHDITKAKPEFFPKRYKMDLIFFDPPYWSMNHREYVDGSVSDKSLPEFYDALVVAARNCLEICADTGHLALLIQNQTGSVKGGFEGSLDHVFALYQRFESAGWKAVRRIACPMKPDNNGGGNEAQAKQDKRMLGLVRDLVIFRKSCKVA